MSFNSQLSIYIPRVFPNWRDTTKMMQVFETLQIGRIRRIDFVDKETDQGVKFSQAFIHFHEWYDNNHTRNLQKRIGDVDDMAKIVYDDPWFWMLFKNTNPLTEGELRLHERIAEMEKTHAQEQANTQYWLRTILTQLEQQNKNIGCMWNHCTMQGMAQNAEFKPNLDEFLDEMDLQQVDGCIEDAERTRREFQASMERMGLGTQTTPIDISDDDSMPGLVSESDESEYDMPMPTPMPCPCPSTPKNNTGYRSWADM